MNEWDGLTASRRSANLAVVSPRTALSELLCELFEPAELRRFVCGGVDGQSVENDLPGAIASHTELADRVVAIFDRRGLIGDLLVRLQQDRPLRRADIDRVAALWQERAVSVRLHTASQKTRVAVFKLTSVIAGVGVAVAITATLMLGNNAEGPPRLGTAAAVDELPQKSLKQFDRGTSQEWVSPLAEHGALPTSVRTGSCKQICDAVYFSGYSAALDRDQLEKLEKLAGCLIKEENIKLIIEGHAAYHEGREQKSAEYAKTLSERRARAVRSVLAESGISFSRLTTIYRGDEDATERDQAGMSRERRVRIYCIGDNE